AARARGRHHGPRHRARRRRRAPERPRRAASARDADACPPRREPAHLRCGRLGPQPRGVRGDPPQPDQQAKDESPAVAARRVCSYTRPFVQHRNRSARIAVLGSPVPRSRPPGYSSRSVTAVRRRIVAGALVLISIVLITIYFREPAGGGLHGVQSVGASVLRPFEVASERVARPFRDAYGWFAGLIHAKSQNADLRAQVDKLSQLVIQNRNAAQESADLKRLLHYVGTRPFPDGYD